MIVSRCCVCGINCGDEVDDGRPEVRESHGLCQSHYAEALESIERQFIEFAADLAQDELKRMEDKP